MASPRSLLASLFLVGLSLTQLPKHGIAQAQTDPSSVKDTIRALEAQMQAGVLNSDVQTLRPLWAEDFVVNSPRNVVVPHREAVLDVFRKGIAQYTSYEPTIETIRVKGPLAIVMGTETVQPVGEAPHAGKTVERRYTHVWRVQADEWRLVARHANITDIK